MSNLSHNTDAVAWATEFVNAVKENPKIATDEGTMISWFANAIMAGHDEARLRYEMVNLHEFLMRSMELQFDEESRRKSDG